MDELDESIGRELEDLGIMTSEPSKNEAKDKTIDAMLNEIRSIEDQSDQFNKSSDDHVVISDELRPFHHLSEGLINRNVGGDEFSLVEIDKTVIESNGSITSSQSSSSPTSSPDNPKKIFLSKKFDSEKGEKKTKKVHKSKWMARILDRFGFILFPLFTIIQVLLRGLGQVVFCNNAISGIFILVGLFVQDPMLASGSLVAVATNSLTATILGIPKDLIKAGLHGYNGVLVGAALATFLVPKWQATTFVGIIFSSIVATCIHIAMVGFLTPYSLPVLTMPFNLSVVIFLFGCLDSNYFHVEFKGRIPDVTEANDIYFNVGETFLAIPRGVGQVYLCDNYIAGLLILFGIFVNSRISGFFAIVGSTLGMLYGYAIGVASSSITSGLWGFNPVLASMAVGGFFFKLNLATGLLAILAGLTSSMLFAMWRNFFSVWGVPSGTFGFCTGAYIFLFMKDNIPFLHAVPLGDITTPEGNLGLKGWRALFPLLALLPTVPTSTKQFPPP
eukprot:TRINITY_DN6239_c0_g1_i1.p1 TRINITY_DN6239_c0_g1~~TRINITY_DN6239_c0_g1_i1.p1  ORF type:complete len:502 (+),score=157.05 TRINITY_DN6239_c0_g1_i1:160-1665(+)